MGVEKRLAVREARAALAFGKEFEEQVAAPPGGDRRKLSYKEQRELEALPERIETLEAEQRALHERTAGVDFYKESAEAIRKALARVDTLQAELTDAYARWHELESRTQG